MVTNSVDTLSKASKEDQKPNKKGIFLKVKAKKCVGCKSCVNNCKHDVFAMDKDKKVAFVANLEACVGCGKCVKKLCKYDAIKLKKSKS